ncbi:glycosyltransferase family 2 protein [Aliiroseovarius subalbicans]|uniref:glycosyltransferase family 2 protein n=1 Tax=Aliiroseovarius subalbicans TaxID=2925840 RepID=UPI001F586CFA|nr:glycosyltransferase family 2 protein [Aliiroseovarius subalbicans]MCI2400112.1 glycosyltransferase family 2 protein [Aliiroseovarius subalbicans]
MRRRRRRLLYRSIRARRQLTRVTHRPGLSRPDQILGFATLRNEIQRLPFYLAHYRALGVGHFLIVDNDSDDGTAQFLSEQTDVSLWSTRHSYKASRFGVDWLTWLQFRYGHGRWCLTADADEILVFPHMGARNLHDLTQWLDQRGASSFGAVMLDLYPKGRVGDAPYEPGTDPTQVLDWFDADNYSQTYNARYQHISVRGGVRERAFFADKPDHAPHLHKLPLVKWSRRYAYASSTHIALPRRLNHALDPDLRLPTGVLLHTKFLNSIIEKSAEEQQRQEHFTHPDRYGTYYTSLTANPVLWHEGSVRYEGQEQLEHLGLMTSGDWK